MQGSSMSRIRTDVLVVGGGGAAVRAAIEAVRTGASVRLVSKGRLGGAGLTATAWSEILSIGAALGHADPRDNPEVHYRDTMARGEGFCDPRLVRVLAEEAPQRVMELVELGVPFERDGEGLRQGVSDFATYPRTCRATSPTGNAILVALLKEARRLDIPMEEGVMVADLLMAGERVAAALAIDLSTGDPILYEAGAIVLATGGVGDAFSPTLSDWTMTGDGLAMALRAGARLVNMDFHQYMPGVVAPITLVLSKPLYALKPRLVNGPGEELLSRYMPDGVSMDDAYRHKVSPYSVSNASRHIDEGIYQEILAGRGTANGAVYYDFTSSSEQDFLARVPNSYRKLLESGVDPARQPVEVSILFQMVNGGVSMVDDSAMSDVPGLFVAGETAGGVRGPDRPGGNSLAEGQVFGARSGRFAAQWAQGHTGEAIDESALRRAVARTSGFLGADAETRPRELRQALKRVMWEYCLVVKRAEGLERGLSRMAEIESALAKTGASDPGELATLLGVRNALLVCRAIATSALQRQETRASHYREDFPETDEAWRKSISVRLDGNSVCTEPVTYPPA
jgi:succinate dehydrogenase/fumarate reductase flavoprotein subunit